MSRTVRSRFFNVARTALHVSSAGAIAMAGLALPVELVSGPSLVLAVAAAVPIDLGAAATYSVLTPAAVGNTVSAPGAHHTTLRGDLGAGGAVTGFPPGVVTGITRSGGGIAGALVDLGVAYDAAAARGPAVALAPDLIGLTLHAGVHFNAAAVANTGTVTLDGQGNVNSVFVFQVGGALAMAAASKVLLVNGAQASRVFWRVNGAATIGAGATIAGTVMAHDAIGVGAGALVNGRMLALTGAVAVNDNDFFSNPPSMSIAGGVSATTNTATPTITGITDIVTPSTVSVSIAGQNFAATVTDGAWSVSPTVIANGTYLVTASATDAAGNIGAATQSLTIDTVLPIATLNGGAVVLTNDSTPTISGTTDVAAGSIVTVMIGLRPSTALVQADGSWNVTSTALTDGTRAVVVSVVDAAGNAGSATQSLTIDATPALVTVVGGASALTNDATPSIAGTADAFAGTLVSVSVEGQTITTTTGAGGAWSLTAATLFDGVHYITVTTTDAAGNAASATQTLTVDTVRPIVTIVGGATLGTNDTTPTSRGTAGVAPGSLVTVYVAGHLFVTLVQADGTWNVTPLPLVNGTYTVTASITDPAGNVGSATQAMTIDTGAPTVTSTGGDATATNDPTHPISGTTSAPPGSVVTVMVNGQVLTTTVQSDGTWSVTPAALANGTYTVLVSVTDPSGSTNTAVQVLTVDSGLAPADYSPVGPKRVFDTRPGQSPDSIRKVLKQKVGGAYELEVRLTDLPGFVPVSGVGAVSLNVTASNSEGAGFVTVYACGVRELVSSLNISAGKNVANAVVTPVSAAGTVCFYSNVRTDIIVDVNGWLPAGGALSPVGPKRVFDTRAGQSPGALRSVPKSPVTGGTMLEVEIANLPGLVPSTGVGIVSLNVTVTNPVDAGYLTVYSCATRELVSSVNFVAGQTVANAVLAAVSAAGTVCFFASVTTDIVVDINGWVKAGSDFTGLNPRRVLDTRAGQSPDALRDVAKHKIGGEYVLEVRVTDLPNVTPAGGVAAVSLNVTATNPEGDGYVTVSACGTREQVSSLNFASGETVANAVLAPVSATGTICLYSQVPTDIIVDINGWFAS